MMRCAEQPAQEHTNLAEFNEPSDASVDDSSAARPAPQLDGSSMPRSLQECSEWLKAASGSSTKRRRTSLQQFLKERVARKRCKMHMNHKVYVHQLLLQVLAFRPSRLQFSTKALSARFDSSKAAVLHNLQITCLLL